MNTGPVTFEILRALGYLNTGLDSLGNHKVIGFLRNTGPDTLENHKAINFLRNTGPDTLKDLVAIVPYSC